MPAPCWGWDYVTVGWRYEDLFIAVRQAAQKAKKRYKEATASDHDSDSDFDMSGLLKSFSNYTRSE